MLERVRAQLSSAGFAAIAAAVPAMLWIAAWPAASARASVEGELVIVDRFTLDPSTVTVGEGEPVTFQVDENETLLDPMLPFTLVGDDDAFRSPPLEPGETWRVVLPRTGLYRYRIERNPEVEGVIIVE